MGDDWRYWLDDMQACDAGDHGDWWRERFEEQAVAAALGQTRGTWQEWRDIRLSERAPSPDTAADRSETESEGGNG